MSRKKAEMQSQIFIYIMALVIGTGILIYGYNAVKGFKTQADDVLYMQFENNIKNDFKSISFSSVKVKEYELPMKIAEVCFAGKDAKDYDVIQAGHPKKIIIQNALDSGTNNNVFLYPTGEKAFYAGVNIKLDARETIPLGQEAVFKCFEVKSGLLKIKIKGMGNAVLVTEP